MADTTFTAGQRVYHTELGCYGRWLEYVPTTGGGPEGGSRFEIEDSNGRTALCPNSSLRAAKEDE
jgi:hypothetical protein